MAQIAEEVYRRAPRDPLAPAAQESCTYTRAIDTVSIAIRSLSSPRDQWFFRSGWQKHF